jgi:hypothetical protein
MQIEIDKLFIFVETIVIKMMKHRYNRGGGFQRQQPVHLVYDKYNANTHPLGKQRDFGAKNSDKDIDVKEEDEKVNDVPQKCEFSLLSFVYVEFSYLDEHVPQVQATKYQSNQRKVFNSESDADDVKPAKKDKVKDTKKNKTKDTNKVEPSKIESPKIKANKGVAVLREGKCILICKCLTVYRNEHRTNW